MRGKSEAGYCLGFSEYNQEFGEKGTYGKAKCKANCKA